MAASSEVRRRAMALALVALVALLAYANSFAGVWLLDDHADIVANPHLRQLWPPGPALWAVPGRGLDGRPVVAFSFALNYALGGLDTFGFHALNLAIHALAGCALYGVVRRTLRALSFECADGAALASALLWTAHPLGTSAVTYIVQRCESLMALCFLLALYAAQRGLEDGPGRRRWAGLALVAGWLGAGSKEVIAVLPLVALAFALGVRGETLRATLRRRPLLWAALGSCWLPFAALLAFGGAHSVSVGFGHDIGALEYLRQQAVAIPLYLRLAVWPHPLVFDYGWPAAPSAAAWIAGAALVTGLAGASVWLLVRKRAAGFAGVAFFLILAPSSSVLPIATQLVAEHRMYLPLAALVALAVAAVTRVVAQRRAVAVALTAAATLLLAWTTFERNRAYASEEGLWRDVLAKVPDNPRAHDSLGDLLRARGRGDEARQEYAEAVRLQPRFAFWRNNYGSSLFEARDLAGAAAQFAEAARLKPDFAVAWANLGRVELARGNARAALEALQRALKLHPDLPQARRDAGLALAAAGQPKRAKAALRAWLDAHPDDREVADALRKL